MAGGVFILPVPGICSLLLILNKSPSSPLQCLFGIENFYMLSIAKKLLRTFLFKDHLSNPAFDKKYNIDTSGHLGMERFEDDNYIQENGHDYQGTPIEILDALLNLVSNHLKEQKNFSSMTFVDYGSGLGRCLFLALEHNFNSVIGIEYCEDLHQMAQANVARARITEEQKKRINNLNVDAASYFPPEHDCILFLFNPFDLELMSQVAKNILQSFNDQPRNIFVIYYNPWYRQAFDRLDQYQLVEEGDFKKQSILYEMYEFVIYRVV